MTLRVAFRRAVLATTAASTSAPTNVDPALHTGITAEVAMLRDLLKADENLPVQQR
jgi:hypothetical protein